MPATAVMLDFGQTGVSAELILPLQELELSFKQPFLEHPGQVLSRHDTALREYLLAHVHSTAPDGRPWTVEVSDLRVQKDEQHFDLVARLWMHTPADAPLRQFKLGYDVIMHEVVSHKAFGSIRNDWNEARFRPAGQVPPIPEAVGLIPAISCIRWTSTAPPAASGAGSARCWPSACNTSPGVGSPAFPIRAAPACAVVACGQTLGRISGLKGSFVQLFGIVTAFTVGHSLTLLISGLSWLRLPQNPLKSSLPCRSLSRRSTQADRSSRARKRGWRAISAWCMGWRSRLPLHSSVSQRSTWS